MDSSAYSPDEINQAWKELGESNFSIALYDGFVHLKQYEWPDGYCTFKAYEFEGTYVEAMVDGMIRLGFLKEKKITTINNQDHLRQHLADVNKLVEGEFSRQFNKWGNQYHTIPEWALITAEEWGEAIKATNECDLKQTAKEIIDTIACAVQMYHEVMRQQEGVSTGKYTPTNTLKEDLRFMHDEQ